MKKQRLSTSKAASSTKKKSAPANKTRQSEDERVQDLSHDEEPAEDSGDEFEAEGDDSEFEEEPSSSVAPIKSSRRSTRSKPQGELVFLSEDEDGIAKVKKIKPTNARKKRYIDEDASSPDDENVKQSKTQTKPKPGVRTATRPAAKPKPEPFVPGDGPIGEAILAGIPDAVFPNSSVDPSKKMNFFAMKASQASGPQPTGDLEIPNAQDNCLAGMTFVFTGIMPRLPRDQAQAIVKQYGGRVTTAPSGKTTCVVIGSEAGPSKIQKIKKLGIKAIDEDGFLQLLSEMPVGGGSGEAAHKALQKQELEKVKVEDAILDLADHVKEKYKDEPELESQALWTSKYSPTVLGDLCGNKGPIQKLSNWLADWQENLHDDFRHSGQDGTGVYRAVIISGPPGVGKTTAAHLAAHLHGYDILESNASDSRSKNMLIDEVMGSITNNSLMGYFRGGASNAKIRKSKKHICLIMDEVDGMSGGDRGGVGQMAALCKKTEVPIILICNERSLPKMRPFDRVAYDLQFRRPDANALRVRIMAIAKKEGIDISPSVADQLVSSTTSDIRQIINVLYTFSLTNRNMDFENNQEFGKSVEKTITLKPFDILGRFLSAATFSNSRISLDNKIRYYFDDHDFSPLMVQENYLNTFPASVGNGTFSSHLEAVAAAADAIADADLVDKRIRGSQPQWSLMPFHGVMSTVLPCSYIAGQVVEKYNFTSFLGQASKGNKYSRLLQELQSHTRLSISGDKKELRLQYLPLLTHRLIDPLLAYKAAGIKEVMKVMDSYHLTKEDWDVVMELGVGPQSFEPKAKAMSTAIKSAFTKVYNKTDHFVPFMKSPSMFTAKATAVALPTGVPDLEETVGEEQQPADEPADDKDVDQDVDQDLSKDKYIKMTKPKDTKSAKGAKSVKSARKPAIKQQGKPISRQRRKA